MFVSRFEIREQTHLLENAKREVLRLVHNHHRTRLQRHEREQELMEHVDEILARRNPAPWAEFPGEHPEITEYAHQQVLLRQKRVQDERHAGPRVQPVHKGPAERGLPGADVTSHHGKPLTSLQRVLEQFEGVGVRFAAIQEFGVGGKTEGSFVET